MSNARHRVLHRKLLYALSLIVIIRLLLTITAVVCVAYGAYCQNLQHLYIAGGCFAALLVFQMIHSMESVKVVCPMCRSHILQSKKCSKHKESKKLFGSYVLRIALQVIFSKCFRCQFCNKLYQWRGKNTPTFSKS